MGADAVGVVGIASEEQEDGVAGADRVRGASPLNRGGAIQVGSLIIGCIGQRCALLVKPARALAQLIGGQQENGVRSCGNAPVTVSRGVVILGGADEGADVGVQHIQIGTVQPGPHGAACPSVHIGAVPVPVIITVLAENQRPPGPVEATFVIMFSYIKFYWRTVFYNFNNISFSII